MRKFILTILVVVTMIGIVTCVIGCGNQKKVNSKQSEIVSDEKNMPINEEFETGLMGYGDDEESTTGGLTTNGYVEEHNKIIIDNDLTKSSEKPVIEMPKTIASNKTKEIPETKNLEQNSLSDRNDDIVIENIASTKTETQSNEVKSMRLFINDKEIPVIWEENEAVAELNADTVQSDITVAMSMYSNNEQVGSLGKRYSSSDKQTTTHNGDIVLYNSSNIVLFYGSNSWSYTRLGKINLSESDIAGLLSNGDVTITLKQ